MAEEQGQVQAQEQSFEEQYEQTKYAGFDEKHEDLDGGSYDASVPENYVADNPDTGTAEGGYDAGQQAAQYYSTINANGQDYRFTSKEQLEQMARVGIELGNVQTSLRNYSNIINAAEADPKLGEAIMQTVNAYRMGVTPQQLMQAQQIQAQQRPQQPQFDPNKEPEQGDDEDYDTYEKRLQSWKDERTRFMVTQTVQQLQAQQYQQAQAQRIQAANNAIINYVRSDPEKDEVLAIINDPSFPAQLRQLADNDGQTFMMVYDDIKRKQGKPPFFGAPPLGARTQQPVQQPPQQYQQQRNTAPFSERAGAQPSSKGGVMNYNRLPDFKKMSDKEFNSFKEMFKLGNFN